MKLVPNYLKSILAGCLICAYTGTGVLADTIRDLTRQRIILQKANKSTDKIDAKVWAYYARLSADNLGGHGQLKIPDYNSTEQLSPKINPEILRNWVKQRHKHLNLSK